MVISANKSNSIERLKFRHTCFPVTVKLPNSHEITVAERFVTFRDSYHHVASTIYWLHSLEYTYLDDTLTDMKWIEIDGSDGSFHFTYDVTGPMSMTFYGAEYFYLKNAQGGLAGLIDQQGRRLYPIPLLICIDGAEYSFGFSCYKKLPSDFSSTAHLIRIRVCIGYDWRFWDKTPEIAELKSDGELCFSLRDSSRERMTNKTIFVSGGVVFAGFFIHGAVCDVCVSPVKKKRRMKERLRREAKRDL